ncbi:MAG: hypothetical protein ACRDKS_08560 [Actinomycetota bacterium]
MCISCGCGEGLDDHGSEDNITADRAGSNLTEDEIGRAAQAQGISVEEVLRNLAAAKKSS